MRKLLLVLLALTMLAGLSFAQKKGKAVKTYGQGYNMGEKYAGPLLGLGWHDLMLGGQFEYGFHENISGGAIFGWSSESEDYYWAEYTYTYIAIGAQGNYHFKPGEKFDPFVGAVLGYDIVSYDEEYHAGYTSYPGYDITASAMFFGGTLGCNYDFSPKMCGTARLGYPYYLSVGVSFKF